MTELLHDLLPVAAAAAPDRPALIDRERAASYAELHRLVDRAASGLTALGVLRGDRVAVLMPKRIEKVAALVAVMKAGAIAVPVNALLKSPQVGHILRDSGATALVTTAARMPDLLAELGVLSGLRAIVVVDDAGDAFGGLAVTPWTQLTASQGPLAGRPAADDPAVIFYTSGSTGKPKGVVVSHNNLVVGARSVAEYLQCRPDDRVLAVLSFSFDYGFNQIATTLQAGATLVLLDYRLPQEVLLTIERERITALAGVPPIWIQLAALDWPPQAARTLRYITNSGGAMPRATLDRLRRLLPETHIHLMYGLTEAFRSTALPPSELARRPDSIGRAIPNAEVLVLRPDGRPCEANEPGELVHRGPLVSLGYWNDPVRTAARFRPVPGQPADAREPEREVWSGDIVRRDAEGFLYFIGRQDDMIKTSGFRVSPTEVEEEAYASGLVRAAVAFGVPHERLGQAIVLVASPAEDAGPDEERLMDALKRRLPRFMLPLRVEWRGSLPRNPNGKYDRARLRSEFQGAFAGDQA
ncbi:MAG TPA: acyl-CoA ligase (AMP-forming), exosortase A system-associated [Steroidobacteraceae bacterium]|nr:acyl-CoA ligase (AMP-forming), exosortase A system-associated [Steroidobacteraceae bacterium]